MQIFNGSIFDFNSRIKDHTYILGMEILDNMPHDRLYLDKSGEIGLCSQVTVTKHKEKESFQEQKIPITDDLIKQFISIYTSQDQNNVSFTQRLRTEGIIKRLYDTLRLTPRDEQQSIFAPTGALQLFNQLHLLIPNQTIVLADFDSFLTKQRGNLRGVNSPVVTHKLADPTKWKEFDTYLVQKGEADICFPTDFHLLRHAYSTVT